MKNYVVFLCMLLAASLAFGQQKEKTDTTDAKVESVAKDTAAVTAKADSVTKVADPVAVKKDTLAKSYYGPVAASAAYTMNGDSLTKVNDSLSKALKKYLVLYTAIKEKVIKRDFDPLRMSQIIDSLAARRDSSFSGLASTSVFLRDSISILKIEISRLNEKITDLTSEEAAIDRMIRELKQLKELLDSGILTQAEFDIKKSQVLEKW